MVHGYYARNENFSLKKLLNKLTDEIHFPYSITTLSLVLKMLGFISTRSVRESQLYTKKQKARRESLREGYKK